MPQLLDELFEVYHKADPKGREQLLEAGRLATQHMQWLPNAGPQTQAYLSKADILLYGGQAGGGKSQLLVGWGVNEAKAGLIFRRELTQTDGLEKDGVEIIAGQARFNGTDHEWTWGNGKSLKLGAMRQADSWRDHAGRERDYFGLDEAAEFLEGQVSSIMAWLRSEEGNRTRMILASNPPRTSEGLWIIDWFAPWLDEHHIDPAEPGELRWAVYVKDHTVWVDGPEAVEIDGETYFPMSRTFIPASLEDNPFRNNPLYRAKLQSLPEPLRSQLLYGKFSAGLDDPKNQAIKTEWVRAAQARWTPDPPVDIPMCAIGVDASGGGKDPMVIAPRYDAYFAQMELVAGSEIPTKRAGSFCAGLVVSFRKDKAKITVDLGGGYGSSIYERLSENAIDVVGYKGAEKTNRRARDGQLPFKNVRSAAYWQMRELLDPDQPGGSPCALPPSRRLLAGLCAPTYETGPHGIQIEPKVDVVKRLGWSTDEADAAVMAWWEGAKHSNSALEWQSMRQSMSKGRTGFKVVKGRRR